MFHPFKVAVVSSLVHSSSFLQISLGLHTRHLTLSWAVRLTDQCRFARPFTCPALPCGPKDAVGFGGFNKRHQHVFPRAFLNKCPLGLPKVESQKKGTFVCS